MSSRAMRPSPRPRASAWPARARALRPRRPRRQRGHRGPSAGGHRRRQGPEARPRSFRGHLAGGQGHLKGKIVRIAHCGYYGAFDIVIALSGFEMALRDLGHDAEPGAGVAAADRGCSTRRVAAAGRLATGALEPGSVDETMSRAKVLVKEKIADAGVELLREQLRRRGRHRLARRRARERGSASSTRS